ncbi:MAG: hypothetical protein FWE20_00370 [Defluviitaleaceae bacterium]|nr:hypothetical protein [Defluviitaleaceae bacterium]
MRSAFFEFNVARSAIFLARGGLDIVNHNIANAREDSSFSRQFIEQRAATPMNLRDGRGMIGTGVHVFGIGQHRNVFLDNKFWNENSTLGRFHMQSQQLRVLEMGLNELRGADAPNGGVSTVSGFGQFFTAMSTLSTHASDNTLRTSVIQSANTLTSFINNMSQTLRRQQIDANNEVSIIVGRINSLGNQIASLNEQITRTELTGSRANDLRDSRTNLINQLSRYVNVSVFETERNADFAAGMFPEPEQRNLSQPHFRVMINGQEFVSGRDVHLLETVARPPGSERNPTDVPGLFDIQFRGGRTFDMYSPMLRGQLRGILDIRDGNNGAHVFATRPPGGATFPSGARNEFNIITHPTITDAFQVTINSPVRDDLNQDGRISLFVNGRIIEVGYDSLVLNYDPDNPLDRDLWYYTLVIHDNDPGFPADFDWGAFPASVGRVEIGRTSDFKGIPHYKNQFNQLVRTFATAMNEGLNRNGQPIPGTVLRDDRDASHTDSGTVYDMFFLGARSGYHSDGRPIYASVNWRSQAFLNFTVNQHLAQNPGDLAVSSNNNEGESHNDVILGFLQVNNFSGLFAEGRLNDFLIAVSGELGVDVRQAMRFEENYIDIVQSVEIQRISVSGVDIGEETADMIRFQHIFQAAGQLINVIDQLYDMTINRLGNF